MRERYLPDRRNHRTQHTGKRGLTAAAGTEHNGVEGRVFTTTCRKEEERLADDRYQESSSRRLHNEIFQCHHNKIHIQTT